MKKYINFAYGYPVSSFDKRMMLIKNTGFNGVFLFADDTLEEAAKAAYKANLEIQTVHLPFKGCNVLWEEGQEGDDFVQMLIDKITLVHKLNVKTVIMHTISGRTHPEISQIGIERFTKILKLCEECKIHLALENIRDLDYIDVFFKTFTSPYLAFCFDSGHANAFTKNIETFPFENYKQHIWCLHIHDNDSTGDQHMIPFDAEIDFKEVMRKLKAISYKGDMTLEIQLADEHYMDKYSEEQFLEKCYFVATQLASWCNNE